MFPLDYRNVIVGGFKGQAIYYSVSAEKILVSFSEGPVAFKWCQLDEIQPGLILPSFISIHSNSNSLLPVTPLPVQNNEGCCQSNDGMTF